MKRLKTVYPSVFLALIAVADAYAKISSIGDIESGSQSFAEKLVDLFSGPWGLVWALAALIAAFVESKTLEVRWLIITTIVIGLAPFLIAALLKYVYL